MGFDKNRAVLALIKTNNSSLDDATTWLIEHDTLHHDSLLPSDSTPTLHQPQTQPPQPQSQSQPQPQTDQSVLASMLATSLASALVATNPMSSPHQNNVQTTLHDNNEREVNQQRELTEQELAAEQLRLREKLNQLKAEKEKEEIVNQGIKKRDEIEAAKRLRQQREKWKHDEQERVIAQAERERREEEQRRLALKKQLDWDRKERLDSLKPVGTVITSTSSQVIPTEPQSSSNMTNECQLQIRLPNGGKLHATFHATDTIDDVYAYVIANRTDGNEPFVLMTSFPKRVFEGSASTLTLRDVGLHPRGLLLVQRTFN
jgi:UBX domain-containing protein 1/4